MINSILTAAHKVIHSIFNWIWKSSSDPTQVSLTVKGALTTGSSALMIVIGMTHLNFGVTDLNTLVDAISNIVLYGLMIVGAIGTVVGFITKIYRSLTGKNPVVTLQS